MRASISSAWVVQQLHERRADVAAPQQPDPHHFSGHGWRGYWRPASTDRSRLLQEVGRRRAAKACEAVDDGADDASSRATTAREAWARLRRP